MDDEFPGNTHSQPAKPTPNERIRKLIGEPEAAEREKRVEPIEDVGTVIRRKQSVGRRFFETFFGGDAKTVGSYILMEVLIPSAKDMVADAFTQGVERTLYGEARSTSRRVGSRGAKAPWTSYNRFSESPGVSRRHPENLVGSRRSNRHSFDELVIPTRVRAEEILDGLIEALSKYQSVSVADLYDLAGETNVPFTASKWGWTDLRGADITRVRDGYLIELPKPEPLD